MPTVATRYQAGTPASVPGDLAPSRPATALTLTVYTTGPGCMRCTLTCRCLDAAGLPYRLIDLRDPAAGPAREFLTEDLGYTQAPVCIVDQEPQQHWSGFRPDLIDALARARTGDV